MSLEQYRFVTILFSFFTFSFGFVAYVFLLHDPTTSQPGMTMLSSGIVVPTHSLFAIQGWVRTIMGFIFLFLFIYFGLGSIIFASLYIDLKRRS